MTKAAEVLPPEPSTEPVSQVVWLSGLRIVQFANPSSKSSRKITSDEIPELVEKDITEVDFDELIKRTAASGDYRKAVRLLYLESLKTLNHKKWINWKPYKTNYEYQLELSGTKLQSSFDRLTYNFEYIWYGHFDIDQAVYQQLERGFKDFQSGIVFKK